MPSVLVIPRPFREKEKALWIVDDISAGVYHSEVVVEDSEGYRRRGFVLKVEYRRNPKYRWRFSLSRERRKPMQRHLRVRLHA